MEQPSMPPGQALPAPLGALAVAVEQRAPSDGVRLLKDLSDREIVEILSNIHPAVALSVLLKFPEERRVSILNAAPAERREQWSRNQGYPEGSVGRLMEAPCDQAAIQTTGRAIPCPTRGALLCDPGVVNGRYDEGEVGPYG